MIVLITGASGGLGRVLGATLADKGLTVYGTMRKPQGRENEFPFPVLTMEASDDASVDACIEQVVSIEGHIDVLINCINEMFIGSVEETSVVEVESLYRTNIFNVLRVCKAVIPGMRARGRGTIINMSSLGGLLAVPYMSSYTSAKFALEAMTEAMYRELKPAGIAVVIMQPVAMQMDRPASGSHLHLVQGVAPDSPSHAMLAGMARDTATSKLTPEMVSEKIYQIIQADKKPLRVPMDKAKAITILRRIAPLWLIDALVNRVLKDMIRVQ